MLTLLRLSIGVVVGLMLWTAIAHGQGRPACDQQGKEETLKDLKAGGRIEAKLRETPSC
jgi:hypothetical protein